MVSTPEDILALHKQSIELMQSLALKSVQGLEKLTELNIQVAKASLEESTDAMKSLLDAKEPKAVVDYAMASGQPAVEKATAYAKHVYEIANETGTEIAKLLEKQFSEGNKQLHAAIDSMAKNAPAGSEGVVTFVKSAVTAANTAWDQVNKATKQVVELAEANMAAAASKTGGRTRKAA